MAYLKSGKNFMLDLMIAGDRELSDFLQSRPHDEELGESLDLFEKQLKGEGQLTQKRKDDTELPHPIFVGSSKFRLANKDCVRY